MEGLEDLSGLVAHSAVGLDAERDEVGAKPPGERRVFPLLVGLGNASSMERLCGVPRGRRWMRDADIA